MREGNTMRLFRQIADKIQHVVADLRYSVKSVLSALSGFEKLEARGMFEDRSMWYTPVLFDEPAYYVCARFLNGRHIPLPLVLGEPSEYPLQNLVLKVLRRRGLLREAEMACLGYKLTYLATTADYHPLVEVVDIYRGDVSFSFFDPEGVEIFEGWTYQGDWDIVEISQPSQTDIDALAKVFGELLHKTVDVWPLFTSKSAAYPACSGN